MKIKKRILFFLFCCGTLMPVGAQSVVNTVHNLSAAGPGELRAVSESEVCIFCHTPHQANAKTPLWNRELSGVHYKVYDSPSLTSKTGQPDGSSVLCLSCHDGTTAPGNVLNRKNQIEFTSGGMFPVDRRSNLKTDLSDDHVISVPYNASVAANNGKLFSPDELHSALKVPQGKIQCTSCHNPHGTVYEKFLVQTNGNSMLCISCHNRKDWESSVHNLSEARPKSNSDNPWPESDYETVGENACANCHVSHAAGSDKYLLRGYLEEETCINCHNGDVAQTNIAAQINRPYGHPVNQYFNEHDPTEEALVNRRHVECQDCHNPHSVKQVEADAPYIKGSLYGSKGVDINGSPLAEAKYEYEVCFRCHADSPDKPESSIYRQIEQANVRLEFQPSNPSFHPIVAEGKNSNVSSLIFPLSETDKIYCTDCHASDGNDTPSGPHGSIYPHILKYNYATGSPVPESAFAYELCYSCHDRHSIIGEGRAYQSKVHRKHIVELKTSCAVCHDPHGISDLQGNTINNSHLINFDLSIVSENKGTLYFEDRGDNRGACYLNCHGKNHSPETY